MEEAKWHSAMTLNADEERKKKIKKEGEEEEN